MCEIMNSHKTWYIPKVNNGGGVKSYLITCTPPFLAVVNAQQILRDKYR